MFRLSRLPFIRKITAVMLAAFCLLVPPEAGLCEIVRDVSYTTYDTTYDAIIKMYLRVLNSYGKRSEGHHDLYNEAIIVDFHHPDYEQGIPTQEGVAEAKRRVGYCIYDLNGDGIDEMIIGENSAYVYEVFTMDQGRVRELIHAWGKNDCALLENGYFIRSEKNSAFFTAETVWKMNGTKKVSFVEGFLRDAQHGYTDPSDPFAEGDYYLDNWFPFTREKYNIEEVATSDNLAPRGAFLRWLKEYDSKLLKLTFIPLAVYESGINTENIGILSRDGKINLKETVNIRKSPDPKSKILLKQKIGIFVNILGSEGDYYQIKIKDTVGYVQQKFVIRLEENPAPNNNHVTIYPQGY